MFHTEKKLLPFVPPPHRQSISERRAIPYFEDRGSLRESIGQARPAAKKTLDFQNEVRTFVCADRKTVFEIIFPRRISAAKTMKRRTLLVR